MELLYAVMFSMKLGFDLLQSYLPVSSIPLTHLPNKQQLMYLIREVKAKPKIKLFSM